MGSQYSTGKHAIAECDRCGFRYKLKQLKSLVIKTKNVNILVCPECWEPDQPQLSLGLYPVNDPQAVRNPRPDTSYYGEGNNGAGGSRVIQWGWNPVGFARIFDEVLTIPNDLVGQGDIGEVTVYTEQNTPIPPEPVSPVTLPASITGYVIGTELSESALINFDIPYLGGPTWDIRTSAAPDGTGNDSSGTWLNEGTVSDYEYRWTMDAASEANLYNDGYSTRAANVWTVYRTTAPRSYGWAVRRFYPDERPPPSTITATGLLEIREIATLTVVASTILTLSATL